MFITDVLNLYRKGKKVILIIRKTSFFRKDIYAILVINVKLYMEVSVKKAIEYMLQSPYFAVTWDIGHSKGIKEVDVPFILEHKDKLKHFHIHDGQENPPKNHLALGDGEIDLLERIKTAKECNARCVLETKTIAALRKSVDWIKKLSI